MDEGKIYNEIVKVEATDRDCTPKFGDVCKYEILTSDQPFVIDMDGVIRWVFAKTILYLWTTTWIVFPFLICLSPIFVYAVQTNSYMRMKKVTTNVVCVINGYANNLHWLNFNLKLHCFLSISTRLLLINSFLHQKKSYRHSFSQRYTKNKQNYSVIVRLCHQLIYHISPNHKPTSEKWTL